MYEMESREFPGSSGFGIFTAMALGSNPGCGTKILQATQCRQRKNKKKKMESVNIKSTPKHKESNQV